MDIQKVKLSLKNAFTPANCKKFAIEKKNEIIQYGCFILILIVFSAVTGGNIFSTANMKMMTSQLVCLMFCVIGLLFVFAHGGFDISAGAVVAFAGYVALTVINAGGGTFLAVLCAILVSVALYLFNCVMTVYFKIMSTISSLAIMFICRGAVTLAVSLNGDYIRPNQFTLLQPFKDNGVMIALLIIAAIFCFVILELTPFGYKIKAMGDNPTAARASGTKLVPTKFLCYLWAGLMVGIASVFTLGRVGSISETTGQGLEMDIIIALILGGMSLTGGIKTKTSSAVIGSISYIILTQGLSLIRGLPSTYIPIIKGVIFLVIIGLTLRKSMTDKSLPR